EINQFDISIFGNHQILGRKIAMDDDRTLTVQVAEDFAHLQADVPYLAFRLRSFHLDQRSQTDTLYMLHHQISPEVFDKKVDQLHDLVVVEFSKQVGLAAYVIERAAAGIDAPLRRKNKFFHDHRILFMCGTVYGALPTGADGTDDVITPIGEHGPGLQSGITEAVRRLRKAVQPESGVGGGGARI